MYHRAVLIAFALLTWSLAAPGGDAKRKTGADDVDPWALRTWTSQTGSTLQAAFERVDFGRVTLRRSDGERVTIQGSALCEEDQRVAGEAERARRRLLAAIPDNHGATVLSLTAEDVVGEVEFIGRESDRRYLLFVAIGGNQGHFPELVKTANSVFHDEVDRAIRMGEMLQFRMDPGRGDPCIFIVWPLNFDGTRQRLPFAVNTGDAPSGGIAIGAQVFRVDGGRTTAASNLKTIRTGARPASRPSSGRAGRSTR